MKSISKFLVTGESVRHRERYIYLHIYIIYIIYIEREREKEKGINISCIKPFLPKSFQYFFTVYVRDKKGIFVIF